MVISINFYMLFIISVVNYHKDGEVPALFHLEMPGTMTLWSGNVLVIIMILFVTFSTEKARNKSYSVSYDL